MKILKRPNREQLEAYEVIGKIFLRLGTQILVSIAVLGIGLLQVIRLFRDGLQKTPVDSFFAYGVFAVAGLAAAMFKYLEGASRPKAAGEALSKREYSKLQTDLKNHQKLIAELTAIDKESLVRQLNEEIKRTSSDELLVELKLELANREKFESWNRFMADAAERLDSEIAAQGRRGTINMLLGVATAISGVALLTYIVLAETHPFIDLPQFLMSFIPRLSIVGIIEVFAYFFLRLYKASISEIKYFQNEATNLECRFASLRIALDSNNEGLLKHVAENLLLVERNPVLEKEKTTLELERERLDVNAVSISLPQAFALAKDLLVKTSRNETGK